MIQILLNDVDISDYVVGNSFELTQAACEYGQLLDNPIPSIVGIDTQGFWNPLNPASVFFGFNDLTVFNIQIFQGGSEVFTGSIQYIQRNEDGTVNVNLQSKLQTLLNKNIIYSGSNLNPAQMFIEVCNLYKIDYDLMSTSRSSGVYTQNNVIVSATIVEPNTTISAFLENLAQVGIASIYSIGNTLFFEVYTYDDVSIPVLTFTNSSDQDHFWIYSKPIISTIQKDHPIGYSVTYTDESLSAVDQTLEFGDQTNSYSVNSGVIKIMSLQSATWVGEQWLEYLGRNDLEINFSIPTEVARELHPGYVFRVDLQNNTIPMNFSVHEISILNNVESNLKGIGHV